MIDTSTGTIQFKANFANDKDELWPGEFVNAHMLVDTLKNVLTVPHLAVQHGPEGLSVYVMQQGDTVKRVPVETGYDDGTNTVITKGLNSGVPVIVEGLQSIRPGIAVKTEAATIARPLPQEVKADTVRMRGEKEALVDRPAAPKS